MNELVKRRKSPLFFYGWIIVAISLVTMAIAYATRYSFSVFYVAILDEFGWLRAETALAFSVNMIIYAALSPVAGTLIDRFGPRIVFPIGATICGLGMLGLSSLNSILQLYFYSGIVATGLVCMGYIAHSCILPHWFSLKLGTALGFAVVGTAVANISTMPIQYLIENIGWRQAYVVLGIIVVAVIVPITAFFQRHRAQDMGLPLDGVNRTAGKPDASTAINGQEDLEDQRIVDKNWASTDWTLARAARTAKFWYFSIQSFIVGIAYNIILVHTVRHIVDVGYSKIFAASIFAIVGSLGLVSALGGAISDRIGREWTYTLGAIGMCMAVFVLMSINDTSYPWMLYLFAVLFGVCQGIDRPITMAAKANGSPYT